MAIIGRAEVEVVPNTKNFAPELEGQVAKATRSSAFLTKAIAGADKALAGFGLTTRDVGVVLGAGFATSAAFAAREVVQFGAASVQAAANLEEAQNKTDVVFGAAAESVREFADGAATSLGQSERAALEAASTFGNLAVSMGIPEDAAAKLSTNLTRLASDLASLNNVSPEEAFIALRAALVGETEPIRRLGVNINQAALEAEAATLGFEKLGDTLDPQAKLFAAYQLIVEQTGTAQGDFARTSESLANQQRILRAEFEDLQASLGEVLLPTVLEFTETLNNLAEAAGFVKDSISGLNIAKSLGLDKLPPELKLVTDLTIGFGKALPTLPLKAYNAAVDLLNRALGRGTDETEEYTDAEDLLIDTTIDAKEVTEQYADAIDKASGARTRLNRAIADAERAEDNAERQLDRSIKDAELREDKAERSLAEALEDRQDAEHEANERITDARKQGDKAIRDARERLRDFEIDSAKEQEAAEQRLIDTRRQRTQAIQDATIALENARAAGDAEAEAQAAIALSQAQQDRGLANTERDIEEERKERLRERDRLERELAEARKERDENVKEAEEDKAKAIEEANERVADSERDLAETQRQNLESVEDAQRRLNDARREGNERVEDARRAFEKLQKFVDDLIERMVTLNDIIDDTLGKLGELGFDPNRQDENSRILEGNAAGGFIAPGQISIVGERGPELAMGGRDGATIFPSDVSGQFGLLIEMFQRFFGGGFANMRPINIVRNGGDDRVLANELAFNLMRGLIR